MISLRKILVVFTVLFSQFVFAQSGMIVHVYDLQNRAPIVFGQVVYFKVGDKPDTVNTDIKGSVKINPLDTGMYDIIVNYSGYQPYNLKGVKVEENLFNDILIKMRIVDSTVKY